jgi:hypothetical protein
MARGMLARRAEPGVALASHVLRDGEHPTSRLTATTIGENLARTSNPSPQKAGQGSDPSLRWFDT